MAENHPVGFQYVIEARLRSAKVIHVDPRYSRTSAMCNLHVPIRAGTDIALLGGIINYILENNRYFKEYVKRYTNAPVIINEEFADTEDLDGIFSGWDPEIRTYDVSTWQYAGVRVHGSAGRRELGGVPGPLRVGRGAGARRAPRDGPDAPASSLRLPAAQEALPSLHSGGRRAGLRRKEGPLRPGL
jgi:formate dehydrogenase major subunit